MFIRKYWLPLSVFLVAICVVGFYYLQTQPPKEPIKIYKVVEPLAKPIEPPIAEVPEGDTSQDGHVHADGTWHEGPHETPPTAEESAPALKLTYHAELLVSDPVEALRQQGKERGHWSADYLPDFPPDDMEAMEIARAEYHYIYYSRTIPVSEQHDSSDFQRAAHHSKSLLRAVNEKYPANSPDWHVRARGLDLTMLTWPALPYDSDTIENYRDYTCPSLVVRSHMYPDLPELGERR